MPNAPKRYCPHGIIRASTAGEAHTYTSHQRGYTKRWYAATSEWIAQQKRIDPRCSICGRIPKPSPKRRTYDVDHHRAPSSAGPPGSEPYDALFWNEDNWRLACPPCNARKQNG
jgi:5-methylcytosine-specific restriction endonuclease McrA